MLLYNLRHILRQTTGTNNGNVADDISNRYQYREGESQLKERYEG